MSFCIQARSGKAGAADTSATAETKSEAIKKAIHFQGEGYGDVKIVFDGKTYDAMELAAATID